ncbi:cell division protein FtsZ [Shewanella sairae]|uniref:Cell division protein FtsZ n=1 Tax=Shewanella sairae TaxID=190310 RepID=A0ABQ4PFC7_9GAMM|nr:cell division protein FtsZ [Shewanella sairae]MCL1131160.1 cell division protein FtsZ [Shewanella sairae]GIU46201.1 cell division protein FtsZ [Shewanella sairae]
MFELLTPNEQTPRITVFGVGGCGCNTINQLSQSAVADNVQLVAVNTDAQSLTLSQCSTRLQIGQQVTKGLGAGARPQKGYEAAKESDTDIRDLIEQADVVFITGGMGGGTGTGAIPFMASIAAELNKPLVAVVTTPFSIEGHQRSKIARAGIDQLMQQADAVIVLPNDKLLEALDKKISLVNAFYQSNGILQDVLQGLTTTISQAGLINIDLNDFVEVISHHGRAAMGVAKQMQGDDLQLTINNALKNPLLEQIDLTKAKGAIVSVMATDQIELSQYNCIGATLQQQLDPDALVIIGLTLVPELDCELELMVIATGISDESLDKVSKADDAHIQITSIVEDETLNKDSKKELAKPVTVNKARFDTSELLNLHDFLKEKSARAINLPEEELDIPTYTRKQTC